MQTKRNSSKKWNQGIKEPLEVLHYVDTRWESLLNCVERLLKLWDHLKESLQSTDSRLKEEIADPEYNLYIYALYILLHKFIGYVIYFQKITLLYDQVFDKMKESYVLFGRMLLKSKYQEISFEEIIEIPFEFPENARFKEILADKEEFSKIFGFRCPNVSNLISLAQVKDAQKKNMEKQCYQHINDFILKTVRSLKSRLPFENSILHDSLAVHLKQAYSIDVWRNFIKLFPTIITKEHEISYLDEIDSFSLRYKNIVQEHKASGMSIIKRWKLLKEDYPNLFQVAKALLIIPYSTSTVESLFSEFRAFKTNYRNRLNVANLEASVLAEQYFRKENPRILPAMIDKHFTLWKEEEKKRIVLK